mmetsp:Transcript_8173/g.12957  ORF Transcript_8173/g.12957 Transcript_8173/m.12957 type:complete len:80 (-) Transcript_8173:222-461(-)
MMRLSSQPPCLALGIPYSIQSRQYASHFPQNLAAASTPPKAIEEPRWTQSLAYNRTTSSPLVPPGGSLKVQHPLHQSRA